MAMLVSKMLPRRTVLSFHAAAVRIQPFSSTTLRPMAVQQAPASSQTTPNQESIIPFEANPANFPPPKFYVARSQRQGKQPLAAANTQWFGDSSLRRNDRRCPSRDVNFTPLDWARHKSPYRRIRHMLNIWSSSTVQRLVFPELTTVATIAASLAYYNEVLVQAGDMLAINPTAFSGATTAIGILAGFRLNASYGRFEECRIFWGDTNNTIRDLTRQALMWLQDGKQKQRLLQLCRAYPVVLNFHLNAKGCHHNILRQDDSTTNRSFEDRVHAEFLAELRHIYTDDCPHASSDLERIAKVKYQGGNTPIEVLTLIGETIAASVGTVDAIYVRELDEQCQRLCAAFGASERVLRTSLPTSFTRHTSRLMFFWSNALPFALYPALGPYGTLPAAIFTSWALQSIEDIGVQLEEPFFVLPMRQYSDGMYDAIGQMERNYTKYELPLSLVEDVAKTTTMTSMTNTTTTLNNRRVESQECEEKESQRAA